MGEQRKEAIPRCAHPCPIEVSGAGAGKKRARCSSCGATGPERTRRGPCERSGTKRLLAETGA